MSGDSNQTPRTKGAAILRDFQRRREEARKGSILVVLPGDDRVYGCKDAYAAAALIRGWDQRPPPENPARGQSGSRTVVGVTTEPAEGLPPAGTHAPAPDPPLPRSTRAQQRRDGAGADTP